MSVSLRFRAEFPSIPRLPERGLVDHEALDVSEIGVAAYLHRSSGTDPIRKPSVKAGQTFSLNWDKVLPAPPGKGSFACLNVLVYGHRLNTIGQRGMVLIGGAHIPLKKLMDAKESERFPLRDTAMENRHDPNEVATHDPEETKTWLLHAMGNLVLCEDPTISPALRVALEREDVNVAGLAMNIERMAPIPRFAVNSVMNPYGTCPDVSGLRCVPKFCKYREAHRVDETRDMAVLQMYNDLAEWTWKTWLNPGDEGSDLVMEIELLCQVIQRVASIGPYFFDRHWDGTKMSEADAYFSLRLIPEDSMRCGDCDDYSQEMMRVFTEIAQVSDAACREMPWLKRIREAASLYHPVTVECLIAQERTTTRGVGLDDLAHDDTDTCGLHVFFMLLPRAHAKRKNIAPCVLESTDLSLSYTCPKDSDRLFRLSALFGRAITGEDRAHRAPKWPDLSNSPYPYESYKKEGFYRGAYCLNLNEISSDEFGEDAVIATLKPRAGVQTEYTYVPITGASGLAEKRSPVEIMPVNFGSAIHKQWYRAYVDSINESYVRPFTDPQFSATDLKSSFTRGSVTMPIFWRKCDEHLRNQAGAFVEDLKKWTVKHGYDEVETGTLCLGGCEWAFALLPLTANGK